MGTTRGTIVSVLLVVVGFAMAAFAWRFHATQNRRILGYLTPQVAERIAHAPKVHAWKVAGPAVELTILKQRDVSNAPGISNIRYALVQDSTFDWTSPAPKIEPECAYALHFDSDAYYGPVLVFDAAARRVTNKKGTWLTLQPASSREIKAFFDEQLGARQAISND